MFNQNGAQAQPGKRTKDQDDTRASKRQKIETPAAVTDVTAVAQPQPQPPQKADRPQPRTVIVASVLPATLPLESRRHVNKWSCFAIDAAGRPGTDGEPKWITERRRLSTSPDRPRPDLGRQEPGATKPKRGNEVIGKGAMDGVSAAVGIENLTDLKNKKGFWALTGLASGPVPKGGRRDLQLLSQLSQLLINAIEGADGKTAEIEAMVVNGRILVSANEQETVDALAAIKLDEAARKHWSTAAPGPKQTTGWVDWKQVKPRKIADVCAALTPGATLPDVPVKVGFRRLIQLQVDCQLVADQRTQVTAILQTLHTTLGTAAGALVKGATGVALTRKILEPAYAGRIILVDACNSSHAEQNLVAAVLEAALWSDPSRPAPRLTDRQRIEALGPVSVAGGKRPCTTCWLTMGLARRYGLDIHCNWHPGGLWKTTTSGGTRNVAQILKIDRADLENELTAIVAAHGDYQQYVSDTRADTAQVADVADMGAAVRSSTGRKAVRSTRTNSLSDSEDNDTQTLPQLPNSYMLFASQHSQPLLYEEVTSKADPEDAVVPGVTQIAFADTADDSAPDPQFSLSDPALSDESDATRDENEPVSSYPDDAQETGQQPASLVETPMETDTPQQGS